MYVRFGNVEEKPAKRKRRDSAHCSHQPPPISGSGRCYLMCHLLAWRSNPLVQVLLLAVIVIPILCIIFSIGGYTPTKVEMDSILAADRLPYEPESMRIIQAQQQQIISNLMLSSVNLQPDSSSQCNCNCGPSDGESSSSDGDDGTAYPPTRSPPSSSTDQNSAVIAAALASNSNGGEVYDLGSDGISSMSSGSSSAVQSSSPYPTTNMKYSSSTASSVAAVTLPPIPTIFVITPTYTRPTQMADMTRLAQTLMLVPNVFWIVSEDSNQLNSQVAALLKRTGMPYAHLLGPRPATHKDKRSGRGVSNRLKALDYLRERYGADPEAAPEGVLYFADDDNAYDIRVFEEMRPTQKVSVWPVGLIAKIGVSTPVVNTTTGKVVGWHDPYITRRRFAVDMAGFAANLQLFLSKPKARMPYKVGYEEDMFIRSLGVKMGDLEPKARNCTEVLVWHSKTLPSQGVNMTNLAKIKNHSQTNLMQLYKSVSET